MAQSKKSKRSKKVIKIRLVAESGNGYFYTTTKSSKLGKKIRLRKYNPKLRQHEWFEEKKIK